MLKSVTITLFCIWICICLYLTIRLLIKIFKPKTKQEILINTVNIITLWSIFSAMSYYQKHNPNNIIVDTPIYRAILLIITLLSTAIFIKMCYNYDQKQRRIKRQKEQEKWEPVHARKKNQLFEQYGIKEIDTTNENK